MFLSFIIPVYNAEQYLRPCLDSLLAQDLPVEEYELVCVNDGSTDASSEILQAYAQQFSNIVVIDQENGGVTAARNAGLSAAKGDYIWFVDSDDLVKENILARLKSSVQTSCCDRLIFGAYQFTDSMREEEWEQARQNQLPCNTSWYDAVVWRSLIKRDFLKQHDLYFRYPDLTHGEDGMFMFEVTRCNPKDFELPDILYFYRVHSNSADTSVSIESRLKKLHSHKKIAMILLTQMKAGSSQQEDVVNKFMTYIWSSLYDIACLPGNAARQALRQMKKDGLFPCLRPDACTLTTSYMTDTNTLVGKIYDKIYCNLHTRWGYCAMRLLQQALALKRKIRNR